MDFIFNISTIIGFSLIGSLVWYCIALVWLMVRFGGNPNFLDNVIMFPLTVLEYFRMK